MGIYRYIQEVHSCIIYNSSKLKTAHMPISSKIDEYILVDLYNVKYMVVKMKKLHLSIRFINHTDFIFV